MTDEHAIDETSFDEFIRLAGPRLRSALVSRFGIEVGNDVTNDAIAWGWEHWPSLAVMANPLGYLCRVGLWAATGSDQPQKVSHGG